MITLSNKSFLFGGAMLMNTSALKKMADQLNSSLYLLPSSVHEIFAIRSMPEFGVSSLADIVKDVNCNVVEPEEYLSDNVYYFDREKCEVTIAVPA